MRHRYAVAGAATFVLMLSATSMAQSQEFSHRQTTGPTLMAEEDLDRVTAGQDNWGQEVKDANLNNGYPGGTSRGVYVSGQAKDGDTPGYGYEIHTLANPGNSNPGGF